MRRIIGQCGQEDFTSIEHMAVTLDDPSMLDTTTLTNRQKYAFHFLSAAQSRKIPWKLLKVVREVLFWEEEGRPPMVEVKFFHKPELKKDLEEFRVLWRSMR